MKYFVLAPQRNGSCYYEFYKGKWDNKTFWKEDSICIHDDVVFQHEIDKLIMEVAPNYNPFGETEIRKEQWQKLVVLSKDIGGEVEEIIAEADEWAQLVFTQHSCFTILGL